MSVARKRLEPANAVLAREIGKGIVTGATPPGHLLPGELEIAERMGVSRSVVREALRMLSAKGLVASRPKAGTKVRPRDEWNLMDPVLLGWMFDGAPPLRFVRDLFELRMVVEPAAAEFAARRRTGSQLARMGHALEEMARHGLATEAGRSADHSFHAVLLEATGNAMMISLSAGIAAAVRWTTFFKYRGSRRPRDPMPEHRALYDAIAEGDETRARLAAVDLIDQAARETEAAMTAEERETGGGGRRE